MKKIVIEVSRALLDKLVDEKQKIDDFLTSEATHRVQIYQTWELTN